MSKSVERCMPFFRAIRKAKDFGWTEECQRSFEELKQYLASLPFLTKPINGEDLFVYLSVSEVAVSTVLIRDEKGKHKPVYYVSKVLQDEETSNSQLVVNHILGEYDARDERMIQYLQAVKTHAAKFKNFAIRHIPRDQNAQEDFLSTLTSTDILEFYWAVYIELLQEMSIQPLAEVDIVEQEPYWMDPIMQYLTSGTLPEERSEAPNLRAKAARRHFAIVKKGNGEWMHGDFVTRPYLALIDTGLQICAIMGGLLECWNPSKEWRGQGKFFQELYYALLGHLVSLVFQSEPSIFFKLIFRFVLAVPKCISTGEQSAGLWGRGSQKRNHSLS
ncbi:hypothetical protein RJ639_013201 [Escallonia herrerae]|uniref:Reverse transcriptase/retrotransposon-derived protein RNase H-like domain-containing protein n=1 Tax=Escallonia herrerae TaxID=1293975 RepID=A0AA88VK73_9ASTE|nr:hypothetical protein RJ639_013201 [Escallonia herrerae]